MSFEVVMAIIVGLSFGQAFRWWIRSVLRRRRLRQRLESPRVIDLSIERDRRRGGRP